MNSLALYKLLAHNDRLRSRRHPLFTRNRFTKFLLVFLFAYYAAMLLLLGVALPLEWRGAGVAAMHRLDGALPYLLIVDFWLRFVLQDTPAQRTREYALLPIKRSFLMHTHLLWAALSPGNLFWGFLLVPFAVIAVLPLLGWGGFAGWLLGWWLVFVGNSLFYLLVRALCLKRLLWCLLPVALHLGVALLLNVGGRPLVMPCRELLHGCALWQPLPLLSLAVAAALCYLLNYRVQMPMVRLETAREDTRGRHSHSKLSALGRLGIVGEYLKLELRLRLRNKNPRVTFLAGIGTTVVFALVQYFSDIYDNAFMTSFICLYAYAVLGAVTLLDIMCHEGNYIDCLMVRRESVERLLRAKYYFNCTLLLLPALVMLPLALQGKQPPLMSLSFMLFTAGCLYPATFQMAAFNDHSLRLNGGLSGQRSTASRQVVSLCLMFVPLALEQALVLCLGQTWAYLAMMALGLCGIATHRLWIRSVYRRFMLRRHYIMEGFRATRNA